MTGRTVMRALARDHVLEVILAAYPHLIRMMQYVAILSKSEAACAIRDYKRGDNWSGEAVNHYGGIRRVIKDALAWRHHRTRAEVAQAEAIRLGLANDNCE